MMLLNTKIIDYNLLSQQYFGCRGGRAILVMAYLYTWCLAKLCTQLRIVSEVNAGNGHKSVASVYNVIVKALVATSEAGDGNNASHGRGLAVLMSIWSIFGSLDVLDKSKSLFLSADQNSSAWSEGNLTLTEDLHRKELTESLLTVGIDPISARTKCYIQWFSICNAKRRVSHND